MDGLFESVQLLFSMRRNERDPESRDVNKTYVRGNWSSARNRSVMFSRLRFAGGCVVEDRKIDRSRNPKSEMQRFGRFAACALGSAGRKFVACSGPSLRRQDCFSNYIVNVIRSILEHRVARCSTPRRYNITRIRLRNPSRGSRITGIRIAKRTLVPLSHSRVCVCACVSRARAA